MATTSEIIESERVPTDIDFPDSPGEMDRTFRQVIRVVRAVALTLQGVKAPEAAATSSTAQELGHVVKDHLDGYPPEKRAAHTRVLHEALRCGENLIDRDDVAALQRDFSQIDDDSLREVRETLGYVSDYYGIEASLPPPDSDSAPTPTADTNSHVSTGDQTTDPQTPTDSE